MPYPVAPSAPRIEQHSAPGPVLGIGTGAPRLSWTISAADPGWTQRSYELEITRGASVQRFVVSSREQILVPWPAFPLSSRESAVVRVRVADTEMSPWSVPTVVEAGLLSASDWTARFITPVGIGAPDAAAPAVLRSFRLDGLVAKARLYASALGTYVITINGVRVGDELLAPGWSSYPNRLKYQTYDVSELITPGQNTIEITLGNGWYRGRLGFDGRKAVYGDRLAALAQLEITGDDDSVQVICTDTTWTARETGIVRNDLYDGQTIQVGTEEGHSVGHPVALAPYPLESLFASDGPPLRATDFLPARALTVSPSGKLIVDFGQNVVGWVRIHARDFPSAGRITVRHAEVLQKGELATGPLRTAEARDEYIVAAPGTYELEPELTYHGFRYAEITGIPDLRADEVGAVVVGSDLRRTGWFETSDELLNRFHENVVWSTRGNFFDIPTDCPQRDERLGWTGDAQIFAPTALFLFDTAGFLSSWLRDLAAEQAEDGSIPYVVPDVLGGETPPTPTAAWGDAATMVPWAIYQRTGDLDVLRRQLPSMRRWVDRVVADSASDGTWQGGFQFGDWLDPNATAPGRAKCDPDVLATAHLARSSEIVAEALAAVGHDDEAERYRRITTRVRDGFAAAYVTSTGRIVSDATTAYALAIEWALLPSATQRAGAANRLADLVRVSGFRISTGFVGTPLVCDALTSTGHAHVAHRLLLQTKSPSWLYPVTLGATTIWERWDSMLPDGSINASGMTSFNHFSLGAVADWLHRSVAGLAPAKPGYRRIRVRPEPPAELQFATATHLTPYGKAMVRWERTEGGVKVQAHIPVGTLADVLLPGWEASITVGHGQHEWIIGDVATTSSRPATIRDLLDDGPRLEGLRQVLAVAVPEWNDEKELTERLGHHLDAPMEGLLHALAPLGVTTQEQRARTHMALVGWEGTAA